MTVRPLCIHAHFNQPGRDNPWLQEVEQQDSAHPYHNWNNRVADECYLPNMAARLLDEKGRITGIVNNYEDISFDFSPLLLDWIARKHPELLESIRKADRESITNHNQHGSALAHPYIHGLLPSMPENDRITLIHWGIEYFRSIFGRDPAGMWLPEMIADKSTLGIMADHNLNFTFISPSLISRFRWPGEEWKTATTDNLNFRVPYICNLSNGRQIKLLINNNELSENIISHQLLEDGDQMATAIASSPSIIATNGEHYGHHHPRGEMALAYCLKQLKNSENIIIVNPSELLEMASQLPELAPFKGQLPEVELKDVNSRENPLMGALDWLSESLASIFQEYLQSLGHENPVDLRNRYIELIINRNPSFLNRWFTRYAPEIRGNINRVNALKLLEMQRSCLAMSESSLWISGDPFNDEGLSVLQHSAYAIQLTREATDIDLEEPFKRLLERTDISNFAVSSAPGFMRASAQKKSFTSRERINESEPKTARDIYDIMIAPAAIDMHRLGAHYAISSLFEDDTSSRKLYCFNVSRRTAERLEYGSNKLLTGLIRVRSEITREHKNLYFSLIHLGDHNLICGVRSFNRRQSYVDITEQLKDLFRRRDIPEVLNIMREHFEGQIYYLNHLFRREQRIIVGRILEQQLMDSEALYRMVFERNYPTMRLLSDLMIPQPQIFATTMEFIMKRNLLRVIEDDNTAPERIKITRDDCRLWNVDLSGTDINFACTRRLENSLNALFDNPLDVQLMSRTIDTVRLLMSKPFNSKPWRAQNILFDIHNLYSEEIRSQQENGDETSGQWLELFQQLQSLLGMTLS